MHHEQSKYPSQLLGESRKRGGGKDRNMEENFSLPSSPSCGYHSLAISNTDELWGCERKEEGGLFGTWPLIISSVFEDGHSVLLKFIL